MVQVKEAVQKAKSYLPQIFESAEGKDLQLEGVELADNERLWKITFSYDPDPGRLLRSLREYKTITLRAFDGEFLGARNGIET